MREDIEQFVPVSVEEALHRVPPVESPVEGDGEFQPSSRDESLDFQDLAALQVVRLSAARGPSARENIPSWSSSNWPR